MFGKVDEFDTERRMDTIHRMVWIISSLQTIADAGKKRAVHVIVCGGSIHLRPFKKLCVASKANFNRIQKSLVGNINFERVRKRNIRIKGS